MFPYCTDNAYLADFLSQSRPNMFIGHVGAQGGQWSFWRLTNFFGLKFNTYNAMGKFSRWQIDYIFANCQALISGKKKKIKKNSKCHMLKFLPSMLSVKRVFHCSSTLTQHWKFLAFLNYRIIIQVINVSVFFFFFFFFFFFILLP